MMSNSSNLGKAMNKDSSTDRLRTEVARIMAGAHQSGHWTCEEIDCHKNGSPINLIMSTITKASTNRAIEELEAVYEDRTLVINGRMTSVYIVKANDIKKRIIKLREKS